jgi:transcriptional regulator with XRE-family HTH domain
MMQQSVLERNPRSQDRSEHGAPTGTKSRKSAQAAGTATRTRQPAVVADEPKVMHRKGSLKGRVTDPTNLAERLISRRQELDLSQDDVAKKIRFWNARAHEHKILSRSAYCMYESGEVKPDLNKIGLLAKVLKCTPEWLAFGIGDEPAATDNLIEEIVWHAGEKSFEPKQTWTFDAAWTFDRFDASPSDLALTMVNDFAPTVKPGDMAVVRRDLVPNASGGVFAFVQDDEIKIAHVTHPTGGQFRIYDAERHNHTKVPGKKLKFLGKVVGRIGDI